MAAKKRAKRPSSTSVVTSTPDDSSKKVKVVKSPNDIPDARFLGEPVPDEEARSRWPHRYDFNNIKKYAAAGKKQKKEDDDSDDEIIPALCHYTQAEVDSRVVFNLFDDAHVKGTEDVNYICKIVEMFDGVDGELYFTAQWFYRAVDTKIDKAYELDEKRVFYSEVKNDNPLDCLVERLTIVKVPLDVKKDAIPPCDYYYNLHYLIPYTTFCLPPECETAESGTGTLNESSSSLSNDVVLNGLKADDNEVSQFNGSTEVSLLDLYSGCGAMSTGLCFGAKMANVNLVTKWAVDLNGYACESLKLNHPDTEVRNESADDFLSLLKEWRMLCSRFSLIQNDELEVRSYPFDLENEDEDDADQDTSSDQDDNEDDGEVFEVEKILKVCYGDPNKKKEPGLHFKVRWKNYGEEFDTWEPIEGLSNCRNTVEEFVKHGYKSRILPLPDEVDVICGGPPCQGVSGFNRFRDKENPLRDEKNRQLTVFMDIVKFLKPKYVLMENVSDLLKFSNGFLGRHALGRLVDMNYQARMGLVVAGAYGLPQFRLRVFVWGALSTMKLPQFPLPSHLCASNRGTVPNDFQFNFVAYDEGHTSGLAKELLLVDALSDLPAVENDEQRDEMSYDKDPTTEFQQRIRMPRDDDHQPVLYDHRPLQLNNDDYQRVCRIPKCKGANFRDLPGVRTREDGKVEWDPNVKRVFLDSGKPLVPDYAMTFVGGTSSKPFGRLWWDETVSTVVTRAEPHNQVLLHPEQDRVLTIRENARLQGFPDHYKLCGPVKERYIQVGNAVAVPVARALGFGLGQAFQGYGGDGHLFNLPSDWTNW